MKNFFVSVFLLTSALAADRQESKKGNSGLPVTEHLFIITTDGFRWQEVYSGADAQLISDERYTPDTATMKMLYWDEEPEQRRKKLMPFFWNVLSKKGQLFGNRQYDNKVNVSNAWSISYPGYHEIFTGNNDPAVSDNTKTPNSYINVFEYLNRKEAFRGKVAVFTSWDVFPYILNEERSGLPVNAGYENTNTEKPTYTETILNRVQQESVAVKEATRQDALTFVAAKEYLKKNNPRLFFLGLGETDEFAHEGRYDLYLQQAAAFDRMLAELWHWVQTTPGYKDHTTFLITTDHGRGKKSRKWSSHGFFTGGSSQTWLAVIGPGISPLGEVKEDQQLYQEQLAQTIAALLGERFDPPHEVASAISLK